MVNLIFSQAMEYRSGVSQASVPGHFFLIYISDLPQHVSSDSLRFADDVKLRRDERDPGDRPALWKDLTQL
ncbi:unnamed protein product [Schistosoma curassoni]|uniref:Reverse transcriptase domain-containing protein n=1 Tax=Schistosoma curassoni TaxID=6186 RepID=A0A183KQE9_9TREM|nr:unnamed protein product [Schistosoma curassoni]